MKKDIAKMEANVIRRILNTEYENTFPSLSIILNQKLDNNSPVEERESHTSSWLSKLNQFNEVINYINDSIDNPEEVLSREINKIINGETLYLYLIDEYTQEPVIPEDGSYPIEITFPEGLIPKLLPAMKLGLKVASIADTFKLGKYFGFKNNILPKDCRERINKFIGKLNVKSTVAELKTFHDIANSKRNTADTSANANIESSKISQNIHCSILFN
jgi:hypothetical protein